MPDDREAATAPPDTLLRDAPAGIAFVERALRFVDLYAMLARTNRAVGQSRTPQDLFEALCRIAVATGRFRLAWVGEARDGRLEPVARAGADGGHLDGVTITLDPADPRAHGPSGQAARTGVRRVMNDALADSATRPWQDVARRAGFAAAAAFPLLERGRVRAVLDGRAGGAAG